MLDTPDSSGRDLRRSTARYADSAAYVLLLVGTVVLPLVFWPWGDDVFVEVKFGALRVMASAAGIAAAIWLLSSRANFSMRLSDWALIVFVVANVIAFATSVDQRTSLIGEPLQRAGLVTTFGLAGVYAVARISIRTWRRLLILTSSASAAGALVAVYALIQLVGADPVWSWLPDGRVFSTIGQPNWLAAYLVLTIPLTLALAARVDERPIRLLLVAASILQLIVLAFGMSRSGYVGFAFALLAGAVLLFLRGLRSWVNWRRVCYVAIATLLTVGIGVGVLSRTNSEVTTRRLLSRAASTFELESFDVRRYLGLWEVGLTIAIDRPLSGAGQDTYALLFPAYRDSTLSEEVAGHFSDFRPESPHNVYLAVASGAGFPALFAYLAIVGATLIEILPRIGTRHDAVLVLGIAMAIIGHVVTDAFMTQDLSGSWLFWALLGSVPSALHYGSDSALFGWWTSLHDR